MSHHPDADFARDTDPRALEVFYEIQRRKTPEQKLQEVFDLIEGLFELQKAGIRLRYPTADEREASCEPWRLASHASS
ncbi:MAG: hypothetical protein SFV54_12550 [Bryobacteraceae bacterium]|nr:hypothetical protein [Bryobacteraceae bacterium]